MKDYKKLIDNLRSNQNNTFQLEAADAIEQLVKERDAAVGDLHHVLMSLGYDATIYGESVCRYCEHHKEKYGECQQDCNSTAENWKWRGVKKASE